jgi:GT2 family glycosyltransferase
VWLTVIRANDNRGFAPGNNIGIRFLLDETACTHILLLNNDATVAPDFFGALRDALKVVPEAGLVTGTIYEDHGDRSTVWYAGGTETPYRALTAHLHEVPNDSRPVPTEFVCGCAMLISRRVFETVGTLAECYSPFYGEDAEYSLRVREAGFPLIYAPRAVVYHMVGATLGPANKSPLVTYCQIRHRVFFVRRNYRGWKRIVAMSYLVATKPGRALFETLKGNPRIGAAILRGFANGLVSPAARVG